MSVNKRKVSEKVNNYTKETNKDKEGKIKKQEEKEKKEKLNTKNEKIINKGTCAGGSNTNKRGLSFEEKTDLKTDFEKVRETHSNCKIIKFKEYRQNFILANKANLSKYMKEEKK